MTIETIKILGAGWELLAKQPCQFSLSHWPICVGKWAGLAVLSNW
jgi:hypothetical protein